MATRGHEVITEGTVALSIVPLEEQTGNTQDIGKPFIPEREVFEAEVARQYPTPQIEENASG